MSKYQYHIIDSKGELVTTSPVSEREAYELKQVYADNCSDVTLPLRIVRADEVKEDAAA